MSQTKPRPVTLSQWLECADGLPIEKCNGYRASKGLPPLLKDADGNAVEAKGRQPRLPMKGLGDVVARTIQAVSLGYVRPCGGCKKRQSRLNELFPFGHEESDKSANLVSTSMRRLDWAYGVTAVKKRLDDGLLERTLNSLKRAGFDKPRLFIDGDNSGFGKFGLEMTHRAQVIRTYGNWLLALLELYIREPYADRYAVFQDDFVTCIGLREYLDNTPWTEKSYLNLYTFPHNQPDQLARRVENGQRTHQELTGEEKGFYRACQNGKGAVALVFDQVGVKFLLTRLHMYDRVQNVHRGHKAVDGGVVEAMRKEGWRELVHNPSLVQHTGIISSMGNPQHLLATSFPGEDFDLKTLLDGG